MRFRWWHLVSLAFLVLALLREAHFALGWHT